MLTGLLFWKLSLFHLSLTRMSVEKDLTDTFLKVRRRIFLRFEENTNHEVFVLKVLLYNFNNCMQGREVFHCSRGILSLTCRLIILSSIFSRKEEALGGSKHCGDTSKLTTALLCRNSSVWSWAWKIPQNRRRFRKTSCSSSKYSFVRNHNHKLTTTN